MSVPIRQPTAADQLSGYAANFAALPRSSGRQAWRRIESRVDVRREFLRRVTIVDRAIALERRLLGELLGHEGRAGHLTNRRAAIHFGVLGRLDGHVPVHRASRHRRRSRKRTAGRDRTDRHPKRTQDRNEKPGHDLGLCHDGAESTRRNAGAVAAAESGFADQGHLAAERRSIGEHRCVYYEHDNVRPPLLGAAGQVLQLKLFSTATVARHLLSLGTKMAAIPR